MNIDNMSNLDIFIDRVKCEFPDLFVEFDYAADSLRIIKRYPNGSGVQTMISRYEFHNNLDPIEIVRHRVGMWSNNTTTLPQRVRQGATGSSVPLPYIPSIPAFDPFEEKPNMNEVASQNKLFTPSDIIRINDVKARVKQHMETYFSLIRNRFATQKYVVAGGCFASLFHNEDPRDYDFFLLKSATNSEIIEQLKIDLEKNSTTDYGTSYRIGDVTYLKNDKITDTIMLDRSRVQLINTQYNTREELVKHFDFKHCCVSYDFFTDKLYITRETYDAIMNKKLIPNDPNKPAAHWRYEKFFAKGWKGEIFFEEVA